MNLEASGIGLGFVGRAQVEALRRLGIGGRWREPTPQRSQLEVASGPIAWGDGPLDASR